MERPTLADASRAHRASLACLALSPCGARLATGGGDGALLAWSWRARRGWRGAGAAPRAHRYGVTAARWAPGGVLLASAGVDGALRVWAARGAALACVRALAAPGAPAVRALAWLGARLLAGHDDGALRVWGERRATPPPALPAHAGALLALAVLADGALLLTGCSEGELRVYDLLELQSEDSAPTPLERVPDAHDLGVLCCAGAPDGRRAATGGRDGAGRLWAVSAQGRLRARAVLRGHSAALTALCWAARDVLASASLDRSARLWAADGTCLHALPAHERDLTSVALAPDLRVLITGSNDCSFRTWSLGAFSADDELRPPCDVLAHFALGDLEGIGPVEADDEVPESERPPPPPEPEPPGDKGEEEDGGEGGATRVWRTQAHTGAINCIASQEDFLATASSDGSVKVWRWSGAALSLEHALHAHRYPALACDFGAGARLLLSAGLDGCAFLWDVPSGVRVRALAVPGARAGTGERGGGGVRDARLAPGAAPHALLATDDGLAPLWRARDAGPQPARVHAGLAGAATCCAWAPDGRAAALGGAGGELLLLAAAGERAPHRTPLAHDLGVTDCDFAPAGVVGTPRGGFLLATAGNDSSIKLWAIEPLEEEGGPAARVTLAGAAAAPDVERVRWARDEPGLLASAGADRWARAWRVRRAPGGGLRLRGAGGAHAGGGQAVTALATRGLLAVGALRGELALWRLARAGEGRAGAGYAAPRLWSEAAVARWLREHVARAPDVRLSGARTAALLRRAHAARLTGARLLEWPAGDVAARLGYGSDEGPATPDGEDAASADEAASSDEEVASSGEEDVAPEGEEAPQRAAVRARLEEELAWLREGPAREGPGSAAPHMLRCPLTHRVLRWPTCAADGFTYERDNILEWLSAAPPEGAVSPMSGRRLRSSRLVPNYKLTQTLRAFVREQAPGRPPALGEGGTCPTPEHAGDGTTP